MHDLKGSAAYLKICICPTERACLSGEHKSSVRSAPLSKNAGECWCPMNFPPAMQYSSFTPPKCLYFKLERATSGLGWNLLEIEESQELLWVESPFASRSRNQGPGHSMSTCAGQGCCALCLPGLLFLPPHEFGGASLHGNHVRSILLLPSCTHPCFSRWQLMGLCGVTHTARLPLHFLLIPRVTRDLRQDGGYFLVHCS